MAIVQMESGGAGVWSHFAQDTFMFPKLSTLGAIGAPELKCDLQVCQSWLPSFILNSIFCFDMPEPKRQLAFALVRKADGSLREYECGRTALAAYLANSNRPLMDYSRALLHFESCIALTYQACCLSHRLIRYDELNGKAFKPDTGSFADRLRRLYNQSKHSDERISDGQFAAGSTMPIWIVTTGLQSIDNDITFDELCQALGELYVFADKIANLSREEKAAQAG